MRAGTSYLSSAETRLEPSTLQPLPLSPPPSNLVAWFPGEGNAFDIQGGNNGTLSGGATYGAGKVGQGFLLNGSGAYVTVPHTNDYNDYNIQSPGFTADFWMKGIKNNQS